MSVSRVHGPEVGSGRAVLRPGTRVVLVDVEGPAEIARLWLRALSRDRRYLRNLIVEAYWDGADTPCIAAPVGDFFAVGPTPGLPFASSLTGWSHGALVSRFPMPFSRRGRIELVNTGEAEVRELEWQLDLLEGAGGELGRGGLHARFVRARASSHAHEVLALRGQGWYVGTTVSIEGPVDLSAPGERFRVDGEDWGRGHSLATYLGGSGFPGAEAWAAPNAGFTQISQERLTGYRWHLEAPIPFDDAIHVELGPVGTRGELATVAFWYEPESHRLPPVSYLSGVGVFGEEPGVLEAESLLPPLYSSGDSATEQITTLLGPGWSGNCQLLFAADAVGDFLVLEVSGLTEARYDLALAYTCGPGFGDYMARSEDGDATGILLEGGVAPEASVRVDTLRNLRAVEGSVRLRLTAQPGLGRHLGLDHLIPLPHSVDAKIDRSVPGGENLE